MANYLTFDPNYQLYFSADAYPGPLSYKPQLNKLFRNRGNGTFEDVSESSGIQIPGHRAMSVAVLDYNRDGAPDLYLSNDGTPNVLLVNDGKGHFKDLAPQAGVAFNAMGEAAGSMAATIGDCNGDGYDDILVTRLGYGSLYMGTSNGVYDDRMMASGLGSLTAQFVGWGGCFLDFDNCRQIGHFHRQRRRPLPGRLGEPAAGKPRRRHLHRCGGQGRRLLQDQSSSARLLGGRL